MAEADKLAIGEKIRIGPTDVSLFVDGAQGTFWSDGDLAVPGGDDAIRVTKEGVLPKFPVAQRTATFDLHVLGSVARGDSFPGVELFTDLTPELVAGWAEDRLAPFALFDLAYLRDVYLPNAIGRKQTVWPVHGDPFSPKTLVCAPFRRRDFGHVFMKGQDPLCDSYSAFRDNLGRDTGLARVYRRRGVRRIFVNGWVRKVCAGWSAVHGAQEGFEVYVIEDATADLPGPTDEMDRLFRQFGVRSIRSTDLVAG
ncbi:MAG: isochorismatase family protein [bacterium]|nr:isochorismatase family protein [bacterium]